MSGIWGVGRGGGRGGGEMDCAQVEELAPDLALGLLDGAERAQVLAHVDRCASCRAEVASLTEMGDHLLQLAPEVPPPPGFESRVLTQLAPEQQRRRRGRRALRAAAAVLAVAGVAAALILTPGDRDDEAATGDPPGAGQTSTSTSTTTRPATTETAELHTSEGEVVGEVVLREAPGGASAGGATLELDLAAWLERMAHYDQPVDGRWWLHVEGPGGFHEMHPLTLEDSPAEVQLTGAASDVGSVAVVDDSGRAWCWGDFA